MTPEPPPIPPLSPPEPPPSQPPIPPAPPPSDFPTSTEAAEANWKTTALIVWGLIGVVLLIGLTTMALTWRSASLPSLPDAPSFNFDTPDIRMPDFDMPRPGGGEGNVVDEREIPDGMHRVENPTRPDPVGRIDKPAGARSAVAGPNHRPQDKAS